jgi:hypothetical protein
MGLVRKSSHETRYQRHPQAYTLPRDQLTPEELHPMPNSAERWHDFDPQYYFSLNYSRLRDDDSQIVEIIRDFFASVTLPVGARGIDVGTGTNLYPALALLPLCEEKLTLWEYAPPNVEWLENQWTSYSSSWDEFWQLLQKSPRYAAVTDPREAFRSRVDIRQGSIFDLPPEEWDIGTMFFVAESISSQAAEFRAATESFLRALRPGSPFAAAFMENSAGYDVGDTFFPAVPVSAADLREAVAGLTEKIDIDRIDIDGKPLREGYSGMLLVRGTTIRRERRR